MRLGHYIDRQKFVRAARNPACVAYNLPTGRQSVITSIISRKSRLSVVLCRFRGFNQLPAVQDRLFS